VYIGVREITDDAQMVALTYSRNRFLSVLKFPGSGLVFRLIAKPSRDIRHFIPDHDSIVIFERERRTVMGDTL
jgi:hypothetical protein